MGADVWIEWPEPDGDTAESLSVTHNLTPLLAAAGFGRWVDHRDDTPQQFGSAMMRLRDTLRGDLEGWSMFDAENGWGTAAGLLDDVERFVASVPWERPDLTLGMWL